MTLKNLVKEVLSVALKIKSRRAINMPNTTASFVTQGISETTSSI
jgi:hypothetical protein